MSKNLASLCLASLILVGGASAARADSELMEWSPSTLQPHEVRLGAGVVGLGLWGNKLLDRIEIDTIPAVYGINVTGARAYDVSGKFEFWHEDNLSLSIGAGVTSVDLSQLLGSGSDQLRFRVVPIEGWAGYRLNDRLRLTGGVVYTDVDLLGGTKAGPIDELGGAIGSSTVQAFASVQYRLSKSWHVIAGARVLAHQQEYVDATVASSNDMGTLSNTTMAKGDAIGAGRAWAGSLAFHYAGKHYNLRLGLEYGNYQVPVLNLVSADRGIAPMFSMYWRI